MFVPRELTLPQNLYTIQSLVACCSEHPIPPFSVIKQSCYNLQGLTDTNLTSEPSLRIYNR